jgi:ABC-2 type transport system permease protein
MRSRVLPVVRKEFREIRRDPLTLWVVGALPLVLLFLFGYAISLDTRDVPMAVLDLDRSAQSASLVDAFTNTGDFVVHYRPRNEREVARLLDAGKVRLALVVPPGFARDLAAGRTTPVQTLIDGSFSARAMVIRSEVEAVTAAYTLRAASAAAGGVLPGGIRPVPRVWYNASLRSATFVVPGLFAVILMAFPPLLTTLAIVREKESGLVQQIYVSPLKPWEFVAGKMIPYVLIAFAELAMLIVVGSLWFRLPFRGNPVVLLLGSVLYVVCTVGIGLLVSTLTRSQVVAILLATIITVMPSFLFSGFLYPISSMSASARWRSYLFPARYYMEISRGTFLKGTGMAQLWDEFLILAVYTTIVFGIAALRFRKKVA